MNKAIKEQAKNLKVTRDAAGYYYAESQGYSWEINYNESTRRWNASVYDTKGEHYEWDRCFDTLAEARVHVLNDSESMRNNPDQSWVSRFGLDPERQKQIETKQKPLSLETRLEVVGLHREFTLNKHLHTQAFERMGRLVSQSLNLREELGAHYKESIQEIQTKQIEMQERMDQLYVEIFEKARGLSANDSEFIKKLDAMTWGTDDTTPVEFELEHLPELGALSNCECGEENFYFTLSDGTRGFIKCL